MSETTKQVSLKYALTRLSSPVQLLKDCHGAMLRINTKKTVQGSMIEVGLSAMLAAIWELETIIDELKEEPQS